MTKFQNAHSDTTVLPGPDPDNPRDRAGAEIADQLLGMLARRSGTAPDRAPRRFVPRRSRGRARGARPQGRPHRTRPTRTPHAPRPATSAAVSRASSTVVAAAAAAAPETSSRACGGWWSRPRCPWHCRRWAHGRDANSAARGGAPTRPQFSRPAHMGARNREIKCVKERRRGASQRSIRAGQRLRISGRGHCPRRRDPGRPCHSPAPQQQATAGPLLGEVPGERRG
jgi:hypothetical protein